MQNAAIAYEEAELANQKRASVILFPELGLTGYTAEDLFLTEDLLQRTKKALAYLARQSVHVDTTLIVGAPYRAPDGRLYNSAFVIYQGRIVGAIPKTHLPKYGEFYERRWFVSGQDVENGYLRSNSRLFSFRNKTAFSNQRNALWNRDL